MTITTSRGKTFDVNWAWADGEMLRIELADQRNIAEIAEDFDGVERVERRDENEGDAVYEGYTMLTMVAKDMRKGTAQLNMIKEAQGVS